MNNYIFWGNKSSADFKVYLTDAGVYATPQREYDKVSVPGRSGDIIIEQDHFSNVSHEYPCVIVEDFDRNFKAFSSFLLSHKGYLRLEDTFHPEEFYMATFSGIDSLRHTIGRKMGSFVLKFDRKPQRWLKSGSDPIEFTQNGSIMNFTNFDALPLIRVYGIGTIAIGGVEITITTADEYTDIDCEIMEAYKGSTNCNNNIVLSEFPRLPEGESIVDIGETEKIIITPRFYTI